MAFIEIHGARMYYETFGDDHPGQAPVVLIHGATGTGNSNWSLAAPLLARERRVIVPDCRGHGRSANPAGTYSFLQMADDTAALVRALGYPRAHIIGHSNGGNVALVVVMEHPEVVQSAVLQAANAYVSPDLVEKEPPIFDPEGVARERPEWMNGMIALHGPTHGEGYWRDLLRLTVQEIITEPNYTPEDLAQVQLPVLVVQGENDRVNAPAGHAQFIAENIPAAELWLPAGIGHTVHAEILFDWMKKITDFLFRRGDDANEALHQLQRQEYADDRLEIFQIRAEPGAGSASGIRLAGKVMKPEMLQAAQQRLAQAGTPVVDASGVEVLLADAAWAWASRGVTDLRKEPRSLAERVSQIVYGEAVRVLEKRPDWCWVRLERDQYLGWAHTGALRISPESEIKSFQGSLTHLVKVESTFFYAEIPAADGDPPGPAIRRLPFGAGVRVTESGKGWAQLVDPDGLSAWVRSEDLLPVGQRPAPDRRGIQAALALFERFIGVPYLWGGRTPFGFDCSGLAQAFYAFIGLDIPRDADLQCQACTPVEGVKLPGDLLFFGQAGKGHSVQRYAHITHVAISMGGDEMIHANGTAWGVSLNSLDPSSPRYRPWLRENLLAVGRFS